MIYHLFHADLECCFYQVVSTGYDLMEPADDHIYGNVYPLYRLLLLMHMFPILS
jgi:hypothetical protein